MQKTYINYYLNNINNLVSWGYKKSNLEDSKEEFTSHDRGDRYLFTVEINENGEPRTFKHELPKEPVKSFINFFKSGNGCIIAGSSFSSLKAARANAGKAFTKCFDETGKEYLIEGGNVWGCRPHLLLLRK